MAVKITRHDIGAEVLSILTRGMYIDPRDALREYVQNGIDAGAKKIDIKVRGSSIVVQDNGYGMDEATMKKAIRIGISDKNPNVDVGFRGIGIYSSFHLCDILKIFSRPKRASNAYLLSFDFKAMRSVLQEQQEGRLAGTLTGDGLMDLQSILEKHIDFELLDKSEMSKTGTRIEMLSLDPSFFKSLTKFEEVADYLRDVVPLHFNPQRFKWAKTIEERISKICEQHSAEFKLVNLRLQVNTKTEQLYRPYANDCFDGQPLEPDFQELKSGKEFFGVAWGCLNPKRKKIDDKELRGFLVRRQGFAIGKRGNVAKYFRRTTFFDRYIGEIIVVHLDMLPNAARTDFEMSPLTTLFYEAVSKVANVYNDRANEYQEYTKGDDKLDEVISELKRIEARLSFQADNPEQLVNTVVEVRRIHDTIKSRLRRKVIREERVPEAKTVLSTTKALEKDIQSFITQARKKGKAKTKGKSPEAKSTERIKKLPETKSKDTSEKPLQSLLDVFEALDLSIENDIKAVIELIDERFIQASANNKEEYTLMLKELRDEVEQLLSEE